MIMSTDITDMANIMDVTVNQLTIHIFLMNTVKVDFLEIPVIFQNIQEVEIR